MTRRLARGFNLIELITVVALVAVMAIIAMPVLSTTLRQSGLTAAVNRVANDLRYAQGQAVTQGGLQRIHFGTDPLVNKPGSYRVEQSVDGGVTWTSSAQWYAPSSEYTEASITSITDNSRAAMIEVRFDSKGKAVNPSPVSYPISIMLTASSGSRMVVVASSGKITSSQ